MKRLQIIVFAAVLLTLGAGAATAQKKTAKKPAAKSTVATVAPLDVRAAREKVTVQSSNTKFWINKLAPVASALEIVDRAYATKRQPADKLATHAARKQMFIQTIRNLRDDLELVESEFRTKPALQKYLSHIQGVTELAAGSEDLAIAGKFVASKNSLLDISAKLMDTLAVMPL